MYITKETGDGKFELWREGQTVKNLLGVYETQEELDLALKMIRKQDERNQFLGHTPNNRIRRKVVVRDPKTTESNRTGVQTVIISDDMQQIGKLEHREIDLLISLGDLMDIALVQASEIYQPAWILAVRGNHDVMQPFLDPVQDLHLQVTEVKGITFGGFSGSWKYKESQGYLYTQEQAGRMLNDFPSVDVFIAHNSPRGVHERDGDVHQGFEVFREYIERVQPKFFLHGHQHVNEVTEFGRTQVVGVYGEIYLEL